MARLFWIGGLVVALASAGWWFLLRDGASPSGGLSIETTTIERRDIERIVASSGAIAPLITVEVGSQLSGQIQTLNADFNDPVAAGELLARIDPQTFETRVREAEAALEVARAQVAVAAANVSSAAARLREAEANFERTRALRERGTFSQAQFDAAEAQFESDRAQLDVARANERNAAASLQQRQANLESARVDLERTYIRSPIDGVVIDRQIDEGQTVAASFNAPVLFLIAQDLSRVQIEAQIDEADIGQIEEGQPVSFDVDAYPDQTFEGEVAQVRLAATLQQNVVTYTVVIEADNPRQQLLPGMTANVTIVTGAVESVLAAPNAALRFTPRGAAQALVAEGGGQGGRGGFGGGGAMVERLAEELELDDDQQAEVEQALRDAFRQMRAAAQAPGAGRPNFQAAVRRALADVLTAEQLARFDALQQEGAGRRAQMRRGSVWIETEEGRIRRRPVGLGLSDGQYTQILGEALSEGDALVTRVREAD